MPTGDVERYLQYHYIAASPHPYLQKQLLEQSPTDKTRYGQVHAEYHRLFDRAVRIFGFEDIMLVDIDTLNVVYSYQKTAEFATNLESGPYSNTLMAAKAK